MSDRLLRVSQIIPAIIPMSKSQWWEGVRSGIYPQSLKLGPRTTCWRESDILALVEHGALAKSAAPIGHSNKVAA